MIATDQNPLQSKVAIVTGGGASSGRVASIGEAASRVLAGMGARVAVVDLDGDGARTSVDRIERDGGTALAIVADLTREADCIRVVEEVMAAWGRLDILVNNVGVGMGVIVTDETEDQWDRAMTINAKSAFFMCKHVIPRMTAGGSIVNLSTTATDVPSPGAVYGASKYALEGLAKHVAQQFGPDGIRCNIVRPGEVWTAIVDRHCATEDDAERLRAERRSRTALLADGDAWAVADVIGFLAGPQARWVTGQTITVDGGAELLRPDPDWTTRRSYWKVQKQKT